MTDNKPPAIREGWCPHCENFRHAALIGGPCYCEGGEVQEATMHPEDDLRALVEQWRKNADEARNQHMASWLNHCADELEAVLDE